MAVEARRSQGTASNLAPGKTWPCTLKHHHQAQEQEPADSERNTFLPARAEPSSHWPQHSFRQLSTRSASTWPRTLAGCPAHTVRLAAHTPPALHAYLRHWYTCARGDACSPSRCASSGSIQKSTRGMMDAPPGQSAPGSHCLHSPTASGREGGQASQTHSSLQSPPASCSLCAAGSAGPAGSVTVMTAGWYVAFASE
eukprot:2748355-Rhodomonas_salina.5